MDSQLYRQVKILIGLGLLVALLALATFLLVASDSILSLWEKLKAGPQALFYGYIIGFAIFILLSVILLWRFFIPTKKVEQHSNSNKTVHSEASVQARIDKANERGIDVVAAQKELAALSQRRAAGEIYVALFGEISTGKSAIAKAMANVEDIQIGVTGGTTRKVTHYAWQSSAGDRLVLADVPGLNEAQGRVNALAQEEAIRAHIVVYVCDSDLTQSQHAELDALLNMNKPVIVAVNKADRYRQEELDVIAQQVEQRVGDKVKSVVVIRSGGVQEVLRVLPDRTEQLEERIVDPDIEPLKQAIQTIIDEDASLLETLRDANVFMLVAHKLEVSQIAHRVKQCEDIVKSYTRKAIVGSLAAVSPGTDLLIQGYLATTMLKELCDVFDVPVRKLDIERFLDMSQSHLGKTTPLVLAVAGNGLKAFPGVGTLVGGVVHAVAYGIIFDALGRSVVQALQQRGDLLPSATVELFKEKLSDNLESRAQRFIQLAIEAAERK